MRDFFLTLCAASVTGGIASLISKSNVYERYVRFIAALACVLIILAPFTSLKKVDAAQVESEIALAVSEAEAQAESAVTETAVESAEKYISECVFTKFGINVIEVSILLDESGRSGVVALTLDGEYDGNALCAYVTALTSLEVCINEQRIS